MPTYRQDRKTLKLIEVKQRRERASAPTVLDDIKPFVSPVDGTVITSRSRLHDHNRRNNVEPAGDYTPQDYINRARAMRARMEGQTSADKRERIEALIRAVEKK
jgi:hypothetical protein